MPCSTKASFCSGVPVLMTAIVRRSRSVSCHCLILGSIAPHGPHRAHEHEHHGLAALGQVHQGDAIALQVDELEARGLGADGQTEAAADGARLAGDAQVVDERTVLGQKRPRVQRRGERQDSKADRGQLGGAAIAHPGVDGGTGAVGGDHDRGRSQDAVADQGRRARGRRVDLPEAMAVGLLAPRQRACDAGDESREHDGRGDRGDLRGRAEDEA